jgi:hypothetical protein
MDNKLKDELAKIKIESPANMVEALYRVLQMEVYRYSKAVAKEEKENVTLSRTVSVHADNIFKMAKTIGSLIGAKVDVPAENNGDSEEEQEEERRPGKELVDSLLNTEES